MAWPQLARAFLVWSAAIGDGAPPSVPAASKISADHRYHHASPPMPRGALGLAIKPWSDDVDPAVGATGWPGKRRLTLSAAPGESEPATFVVYARCEVRRLGVRVTDLQGRRGRISSSAVTVRHVMRTRTRSYYYGGYDSNQTEVVGRFMPLLDTDALSPREFREIWLDVRIPLGTAPGLYTARVVIDVDGEQLTRRLSVRVRPMQLAEPTDKGLGIYYHVFGSVKDRPKVLSELGDMRDHGVENLMTDLRPTFVRDKEGELVIRTEDLADGLDLLERAGVRGTVVIDSGLPHLARFLGFDDVVFPNPAVDSLRGPRAKAFRESAPRVLEAVQREVRRHSKLDIAVAHVDEIFLPGRLELFLELAETWRHVPEMPILATLSTALPEQDSWRRRVDPFVDIRANHGFSFEWWIARGNDWHDYARELHRSGDRAWIYHNERGTWFDARWTRLINGVYLWASPFEVHAPYAYQRFEGDPFDDSDGTLHDFGFAFPDPANPNVSIPTRNWLAVREGWDDLRYLATLEAALAKQGDAAPAAAAEARAFLEGLRADVLRLPPHVDAAMLVTQRGTSAEAPILESLARRYDTDALNVLRERAEELTLALEVAGSRDRDEPGAP